MAEVTLYDQPVQGPTDCAPLGAPVGLFTGYKGGTDDGTLGSVAQACTVVCNEKWPPPTKPGVWLCFVLQVTCKGSGR